MVLSEPESGVSESVGHLRERHRGSHSITGRLVGADRHEVKDRKSHMVDNVPRLTFLPVQRTLVTLPLVVNVTLRVTFLPLFVLAQ